MSLLPFWVLNVAVAGSKSLKLNQKFINLCSKDERRSYGFGTTWGWVFNDRIFIFGWTKPLKKRRDKSFFIPNWLSLIVLNPENLFQNHHYCWRLVFLLTYSLKALEKGYEFELCFGGSLYSVVNAKHFHLKGTFWDYAADPTGILVNWIPGA